MIMKKQIKESKTEPLPEVKCRNPLVAPSVLPPSTSNSMETSPTAAAACCRSTSKGGDCQLPTFHSPHDEEMEKKESSPTKKKCSTNNNNSPNSSGTEEDRNGIGGDDADRSGGGLTNSGGKSLVQSCSRTSLDLPAIEKKIVHVVPISASPTTVKTLSASQPATAEGEDQDSTSHTSLFEILETEDKMELPIVGRVPNNSKKKNDASISTVSSVDDGCVGYSSSSNSFTHWQPPRITAGLDRSLSFDESKETSSPSSSAKKKKSIGLPRLGCPNNTVTFSSE